MRPLKRRRQTHAELVELQRITAQAVMRPLTPEMYTQPTWIDGRPMESVASEFIKPNDRLSSFERLEIYNRQYWFRLIDVLYENWPGMRAVVGDEKFNGLIRAYLEEYPSRSFNLRNLGDSLPEFLERHPHWAAPRDVMAMDMARFEWAQTIAFDDAAYPAVMADDLLGRDPATLQLSLQPYVTLLEMSYPLDEFSILIRRQALRSEASNASEMKRRTRTARKIPLPRKRRVFVAVHRYRNALFYKRLEPAGYRLLCALRDGATLEAAIITALPADAGAGWVKKLRKWFENWTGLGWFSARRSDPGALSGGK